MVLIFVSVYTSGFYECSNGVAYHLDCPDDLYFDTTLNVCNDRANVTCSHDAAEDSSLDLSP